MKKTVATLSALAFSAVALVGCSAPSVEVSEKDCLTVPVEMQEQIASAPSGVGMSPVKAAAFKHPDYPSAYLIAMEFESSGGDNQTGVWSSSEIEPGSPLFSVDGTAKSFTSWNAAADSVVPLDSTSTGVAESKACLAK